MNQIWEKISNNGIHDGLEGREPIRIRLLNQLTFIGFVITSIHLISYLLNGEELLRILYQLSSFIIEFSILIAIYFRRYNLAKFIGIFLFAAAIEVEVITYGGDIGESSIFILLGLIAIVFYEDNRFIQIIAVAYICCLYVFGQLYIIEYNLMTTAPNPYDDLFTFPPILIGIGLLLTHYFNAIKKYENENQALIQNLKQANYELRTFNHIASHDIKEPIRIIGGYASLIQRQLPNDLKEKFHNYFSTIKRSTKQLYTLIEDFTYYSTISRDEAIKKESIDLNQLIDNVKDTLQESLKKYNGTIKTNQLPTIHSSNTFLFTAFKNLIENGLKYNQSESPTVEITYTSTETDHKIKISDNGIGIKEKYHSQIFEMFKRLHYRGAYEGSGIGLAIVKLVTEKLNGTIEVESAEGKGTSFILNLPK